MSFVAVLCGFFNLEIAFTLNFFGMVSFKIWIVKCEIFALFYIFYITLLLPYKTDSNFYSYYWDITLLKVNTS